MSLEVVELSLSRPPSEILSRKLLTIKTKNRIRNYLPHTVVAHEPITTHSEVGIWYLILILSNQWTYCFLNSKPCLLLFICLAYVSLHALFVFDITFFPSGLISLHKIGLYISLRHNCSTDIHNIVVFYKDWVTTVLSAAALVLVPRSTLFSFPMC